MFYILILFIDGIFAIMPLPMLYYGEFDGIADFCGLVFLIVNFFISLALMVDDCIRRKNFI